MEVIMRPKGMSRRTYRDMKSICNSYGFNNVTILSPKEIEEEYGGVGYPYSARASISNEHDEGYSSSSIVVEHNKDNTYNVYIYNRSRDCDGMHSNSQEYIVKPRKSNRFYMSGKDYKTGRPIGRFNKKTSWVIIPGSDKEDNRDYYAEAMGY
jgi:hypothetical protein